MIEGFVFYKSFADAVDALPAEQYKTIVQAVCRYAIYGEEPEGLDAVSFALYTLMKPQIDANNKRREAGRVGGSKQIEANAKQNEATLKQNEAKAKQNEATLKQNEATLKQNEANVKQNEANVSKDEANAKQNEAKEKEKDKDKDKEKDKVKEKTRKEKDETPEAFLERVTEPPEVKERLSRFIQMRRQIKKPLTGYALRLAYGDLLKIADSSDEKCRVIDQSLKHSWQTFYPLKDEVARSGTTNFTNERKFDPSIEALLLGEA